MIRNFLIGVACTVALIARGSSAQDTTLALRPRFYDISLELPETGSSIKGDVTIQLERQSRVDTLVLDLMKLRVRRVDVDRRSVSFMRTDSTIVIPLPPSASRNVEVRVLYDGVPTDGLIIGKDSAGRWTYFGDNWPNRARYWFPGIDRPDAKAMVDFRVTAPLDRTVVANGLLQEKTVVRIRRRRQLLFRWRESAPIPPYLMVIAAGPLVQYDLGQTACGHATVERCVPQYVYVEPEQQKLLPGAFSRAGDIVEFFATLIAPFPYEKLAHLQSRTRFGGMENASAIFYADGFFRRNGVPEGIIAHETAHQWFGDAVTEKTWPHVWLSEGFATYFAALYTQHAHGDSAFRAEMSRLRSQILADTVAVPKRPVIDSVETDLLALLNVNSYQKGGFVLHMLRTQLGDSAFFRGLRDYYTSHKHGNALTDDLRSALERASGKDLRGFFDQWLRRPGYPIVAVSWSADSTGAQINVAQSGQFGLFEFPLPIVAAMKDGTKLSLTIPVLAAQVTRASIGRAGASIIGVTVDPQVTVLVRDISK
ncbi:MAG TPA: M1 family metallopeptidase [Gemmatimonadaceae bacterium]|nr:M1 family metallopeptidase [Gemmatimonadaceae bacterium]